MYPQTNAARSVRDLSGVWDFRFNANDPWQTIAVPASYNDQYTLSLHDALPIDRKSVV